MAALVLRGGGSAIAVYFPLGPDVVLELKARMESPVDNRTLETEVNLSTSGGKISLKANLASGREILSEFQCQILLAGPRVRILPGPPASLLFLQRGSEELSRSVRGLPPGNPQQATTESEARPPLPGLRRQ